MTYGDPEMHSSIVIVTASAAKELHQTHKKGEGERKKKNNIQFKSHQLQVSQRSFGVVGVRVEAGVGVRLYAFRFPNLRYTCTHKFIFLAQSIQKLKAEEIVKY